VAQGDNLEHRLIAFAVRIIRVCEHLPNKPVAKHIRNQLTRSGTSPAPNYAEARGAESRRDFVHKLRIVLKELNESRVWLKIVVSAGFAPEQQLRSLIDECDQLCRIIGKSVTTSRTNTTQ